EGQKGLRAQSASGRHLRLARRPQGTGTPPKNRNPRVERPPRTAPGRRRVAPRPRHRCAPRKGEQSGGRHRLSPRQNRGKILMTRNQEIRKEVLLQLYGLRPMPLSVLAIARRARRAQFDYTEQELRAECEFLRGQGLAAAVEDPVS